MELFSGQLTYEDICNMPIKELITRRDTRIKRKKKEREMAEEEEKKRNGGNKGGGFSLPGLPPQL